MSTKLRKWRSPDGKPMQAWQIHVVEGAIEVRKNAPKDSRAKEANDYEHKVRAAIRADQWCVPCVDFKSSCACTAVVARPRTVPEFAAVWQARNARECAHGTVLFYGECLKHVQKHFHDTPVKSVSFVQIERFKAHLQNVEKLAPNTVNNVLASLRAMLTYAEECGEFGEGGRAPKVKLVPVPAPEKPKYLSFEQAAALLAHIKGRLPDWYALFVVLIETGLRIGEAIALQWTDLDLPGTMLHVRRTYYRTVEEPAGSAARRIPLSEDALEALRGLKRRSLYVFPRLKKGQWVRMTEQSPRAAWKAAEEFLCAREGAVLEHVQQEFEGVARFQRVDSFGPHALRHTFATKKVSEGVTLEILAALMGHADIATTRIYAKVTDEALRAAMGQKRESK